MSWFAPELQPLLAVVAATLDDNGVVIEANAGFLRLIADPATLPIGMHVGGFFRQPDFATLARAPADADGVVHRGLLTVGDGHGPARTLRGCIRRAGTKLLVLAEYDIEELERLTDKVLELNRDYAAAQLLLAQTNLGLRRREAEIVELSLTDQLTGIGNRRRLQQALQLEIGRAERTGARLSALIADIDHFKLVNDTYGHDAGDRVIVSFADLLRRQTRPTDIVARYGGEEFVALMPQTNLGNAVATAERIRVAFAAARIEPLADPVTGSVGVAELATREPGETFLRRVDQALFAAKRAGRNRVVAG